MSGPGKGPVGAVIVQAAENGREPYALLDDGRTMPMGWNRSAEHHYPVGTVGVAEYVVSSYASLWSFRVVCAECGATLTGAEWRAIKSDVDFVEHGEPGHLIRVETRSVVEA